MNVTLRCIDRLVRVLPDPDQMDDGKRLRDALCRYEREEKPPNDLVLADNHARGLEMDSLDPEKILSLIPDLRNLQVDPKRQFAYRMSSAGHDVK